MNTKLALAIISLLILVITGYKYLSSTKIPQQKETIQNSQIKVTASFYPLSYFTAEIGKEKVAVTNLTPAGAEPHDFEPNTQDIVKIEESQILILNGAGFEPWADKITPDLENKQVRVLKVAEGLATLENDPHVWLDPQLVKQATAIITNALIDIDPQNSSFYETNNKVISEKLDSLDQSFKEGLANCQKDFFVTAHNAFGYIARSYGIKQIPISGLSPDEEPSPAELGEITKFAKENNIKYIFFETLVSPRLAKTVATEIGAQTLVLNPLEGLTQDQQAGKDYFGVQRENLDNLKIALECN